MLGLVVLLVTLPSHGPPVIACQTPTSGLTAEVLHEGPTEADLEAEFNRAREAVRVSPQFKGEHSETHFRLGEELRHRGDLTGAAEEYREAIRLKPDFADAYRGLGVVLMDRHDWPGAATALGTAAQLKPDDAEAYAWRRSTVVLIQVTLQQVPGP